MTRQFIRLAGTLLGALSNVPCYLFLLLSSSLGLHWWRMPWKQEITQYLLSLLVVFGASITIVIGAILLAGIRVNTRTASQSGSRKLPPSFNLWMLVISYPVFSAWAWSVREGYPASLFLFAGFTVFVGHIIGAIILGLRTARENRPTTSSAT